MAWPAQHTWDGPGWPQQSYSTSTDYEMKKERREMVMEGKGQQSPQKGWQWWTTTKHNCSMKNWTISCRTECKSGFEYQETCNLHQIMAFQLLRNSKFQLLQKSIKMVGHSRIKQTWELKWQLKMQRLLVWTGRKSSSIWSLRWRKQHLFQMILCCGYEITDWSNKLSWQKCPVNNSGRINK